MMGTIIIIAGIIGMLLLGYLFVVLFKGENL
ncbi:MAG: potassium-transporting ATPase subunit F [Christensenella sp.]